MFFKWTNPGLFLFIFVFFKQTLQFLQQINVKKCSSSIGRQDSNTQPSDSSLLPKPLDQRASAQSLQNVTQVINGTESLKD